MSANLVVVCVAVMVATLAGCSGKNGGGTGTPASKACADQASAVRQLYAAETSDTGAGEGDGAALAADLLEANVHMILTDCARDPSRYVACIARAKSVADLERDCTIALDDEGRVEGRQFE